MTALRNMTTEAADAWRAGFAAALGKDAAERVRLRALLREAEARIQALEAKLPRMGVELRYDPRRSATIRTMEPGE